VQENTKPAQAGLAATRPPGANPFAGMLHHPKGASHQSTPRTPPPVVANVRQKWQRADLEKRQKRQVYAPTRHAKKVPLHTRTRFNPISPENADFSGMCPSRSAPAFRPANDNHPTKAARMATPATRKRKKRQDRQHREDNALQTNTPPRSGNRRHCRAPHFRPNTLQITQHSPHSRIKRQPMLTILNPRTLPQISTPLLRGEKQGSEVRPKHTRTSPLYQNSGRKRK